MWLPHFKDFSSEWLKHLLSFGFTLSPNNETENGKWNRLTRPVVPESDRDSRQKIKSEEVIRVNGKKIDGKPRVPDFVYL